MSRSELAMAADRRRVTALVAECHDLGDDASAWQQHLMDGVRRYVGCAIGYVALLPARPSLSVELIPAQEGGDWPSAEMRDRHVAAFRGAGRFVEHPAAGPFFHLPDSTAVCGTRRELVPDRAWERSPYVNDSLRVDGIDEGLVARVPAPALGAVYLLTMIRLTGDRPFRGRAGRVVECALREVSPHLGRALLVTTQPNRAGLSPRALDVLDALLDGDAEKQVALRLGIGRDTVHDHVKVLYRHFGVCSRAELLAYFLRRYRGCTGGHGDRP